ncbi:hypothetical protein [Nocardioides albus]|uniref:Uncharacterized protein n=1 Tax=Nocardioides albus TaxID=1841 RepID=A0A7W5A561_9ACTN|nr:hypothetical protein [Nocardioides albus]MBB3089600.1 hypothetical protein [Nocardioides albus]GGU30728.1 hypothetical protein GCM10007979_31890 [Nocardioides albus]
MQSKQVAVVGILAGAVMTGLGAVVLVAGLAEAERPDRDPANGYEDVEDSYPDVDPLPPLPASRLSDRPSAGTSTRPGGGTKDRDGATYAPAEPSPTPVENPARPRVPREPVVPGETAGSTPTVGPTHTSEPEPSAQPTDPVEPTAEPTPAETPTASEEPQSQSLARSGG